MSHFYTVNVDFFSSIDSEEKAYILGFIEGDGNIISHKNRLSLEGVRINLQQGDIRILERIAYEMNSTHKIETKTYMTSFGPSTQSYLRIYSKKIAEDLIALGVMPNKQQRERLPIVKKELMRHVIRGVVDADGGFHKSSADGSWDLYIEGSEELLNSCKEIFLKELNMWLPPKCVRCGHGCYEFRVSGNRARVIAEWLYKDSIISLDRKREMYENFSKEIKLEDAINLAKLTDIELASELSKRQWNNYTEEQKQQSLKKFRKYTEFSQVLRGILNRECIYAKQLGLGDTWYYSTSLKKWVDKNKIDIERRERPKRMLTGRHYHNDFSRALIGIINSEYDYAKSLGLERCEEHGCNNVGTVMRLCRKHYSSKWTREQMPNKYSTRLLHNILSDVSSEKSAWLFGYLLCNGSIYSEKTNRIVVVGDFDTLECVKTVILSDENIMEDKLYINSKNVMTDLIKLSGSKTIPCRSVVNPQENVEKHLYRGIFDAWGSITEQNEGVSISIIGQSKNILHKFGEFVYRMSGHMPVIHSKKIVVTDESARLILDILYDGSVFFSERNKNAYTKLVRGKSEHVRSGSMF